MISVETRPEVNPGAVLPRVNLVPAAIHDRARTSRARSVAAALVAGAFVITGGLWVVAHGSVGTAQSRVDQANQQNATLRSQAAKYAAVPLIQSQLAAAQSQLAGAMATDIRFSYLMNDLSLTIPHNVALTQVTITTSVPGTTGGPVTSGSAGVLATGPLAAGIGSITFQGTAVSINAVADWLDKGLANSPAYANPFVTNLSGSAQAPSAPATVTFSSSLIMTPNVYSHRFDQVGN